MRNFVPEDLRTPKEGRFLVEMPIKTMDPAELSLAIMHEIDSLSFEERSRVALAIELADELHKHQERGGTHKGKPYISHPLRNALRVIRYGCYNADIIAAVILHDTVEDQAPRFMELATGNMHFDTVETKEEMLGVYLELFGERTSSIVRAVTNPELAPELSKDERNQHYRDHVAEVISDPDVFLAKFVDLVDNGVGLIHTEGAMAVKRRARKYLPLIEVFAAKFEELEDVLPISATGKAAIREHLRLGAERLPLLAA